MRKSHRETWRQPEAPMRCWRRKEEPSEVTAPCLAQGWHLVCPQPGQGWFCWDLWAPVPG